MLAALVMASLLTWAQEPENLADLFQGAWGHRPNYVMADQALRERTILCHHPITIRPVGSDLVEYRRDGERTVYRVTRDGDHFLWIPLEGQADIEALSVRPLPGGGLELRDAATGSYRDEYGSSTCPLDEAP